MRVVENRGELKEKDRNLLCSECCGKKWMGTHKGTWWEFCRNNFVHDT